MTELEREFTQACMSAIGKCRALGYNPTVWTRMIAEHGAVSTAKRLIKTGDIQSGLLRLLTLGRPDLTIESIVINNKWQEIFTDDERELARWRLEAAQAQR